jgi:hypothetical protein
MISAGTDTIRMHNYAILFRKDGVWLTFRILAWPVHVVAPHYQGRDAERLSVCPDVHLGGGFGRRVRVSGHELFCLVDELVHRVAVYFVGADVDEAPYSTGAAMVPYDVEQPLCGHDVVEREARGILERVLHMRAGREVQHAVDVVLDEQSRHGYLVR